MEHKPTALKSRVVCFTYRAIKVLHENYKDNHGSITKPGVYIIEICSHLTPMLLQMCYIFKDIHGQDFQKFSLLCLSVRLGTKHKAVQHQALALNSSQCQELANYYFGFSGWSKRIIKLQDLSDLEERENEDALVPLQKQSLKFFCALEVVLPSYECRSPGVGMAEEPLEKLEEESGKIAVEYRPCEEITDARTEEELQDLIQVSYFSWKQDGRGEEECLSDLSFEEAEFKPPESD
ncbi:RAD52 motif-containing protein 1-like [Halichoerus grypus]